MPRGDDFFYGCIDASRELSEQIRELQKKQDLLLEIDNSKPVDMHIWQAVLDTPLRKDPSALLSMLNGTFPDAKNSRCDYHAKSFFFDYKGIEVSLPLMFSSIHIDMNWYYNNENWIDKAVGDERAAVLVEDLLPKLESFGGTGVYQWGIKHPTYSSSENHTGFDNIKKEYYDYKQSVENRQNELGQEEELNMD